MCSTLIFLRHGIRGNDIDHLASVPDCLTFIASEENLSIDGHNLSFLVGKMLRSMYGKIDFIYGDISTDRTIDTSINVARGSGTRIIHLSKTNPDVFF